MYFYKSFNDRAFYFFNQYDTNRSGKIDIRELGNLLRALGQNPTDSQIAHLVRIINLFNFAKIPNTYSLDDREIPGQNVK
jgi:Ca2+-binding EF-hand superfamily protein